MERERHQIKLDPESLQWEDRVCAAVALLTFENVLLMTAVEGKVTGIYTESRGGGAKPLPSLTLKENGSRDTRIDGTARIYLFLHHRKDRNLHRKTEIKEMEVSSFIKENHEQVRVAALYAGLKTNKRAELLPPCWIGGYYLRFRLDFEKPERLIRLFFDGLIDGGNTDPVLTATRQRIRAVGELARWATPPIDVHKALIEGFLEFSK